MQVLFLITGDTTKLCFSEEDLGRLSDHQIIQTSSNDPQHLYDVWFRHAAHAEVVVTGWKTPRITDAMLDMAPRLKAIIHSAGSVRHLIPSSIWHHNIRLASAREALAVGVAETTLGLIITGLKGFFPAYRTVSSGGWTNEVNQLPNYQIRELYQRTIGIIGLSKTGRHLAKLLNMFDVKVLAYDPFADKTDAQMLGLEMVELDELMSRSDVSSLHAPALPSTRHMIGQAQFNAMPDGAIFINTARGSIVDEDAMLAELNTGRIWAYLDIIQEEPPALDNPFRNHPNVILLPHIAGAVANGCLRLGRSTVQQILELAAGQQMHGEIKHAEAQILA